MRPRAVLAGLLAFISGGCLSEGEPRVAARNATAIDAAVHVSIEALDPSSPVDGPLSLRVIARNPGSTAITFLIWNTPFETPVSADVFTVTRDGDSLDYTGMLLRRALPPPDTDYTRLGPGESLETVVDLRTLYRVDVPGAYTIAFDPRPVAVGDPDVAGASLRAADGQVTVTRY